MSVEKPWHQREREGAFSLLMASLLTVLVSGIGAHELDLPEELEYGVVSASVLFTIFAALPSLVLTWVWPRGESGKHI